MESSERGARGEPVSGVHHCHWPGCHRPVPPKMWGCAPHWFSLPKDIRDRIWMTYVPGQEETKTPSAAYVAFAREAQAFALNHVPAKRAVPPPSQAALF